MQIIFPSEIKKTKISVRSGIRTHAHIRGPEHSALSERVRKLLESGALDRSAILTHYKTNIKRNIFYRHFF